MYILFQTFKDWFDSIFKNIPENYAINQPFLVSSVAMIYCFHELDKLGLCQFRSEELLLPLLKYLKLKPTADGRFPGYIHLCDFVPENYR